MSQVTQLKYYSRTTEPLPPPRPRSPQPQPKKRPVGRPRKPKGGAEIQIVEHRRETAAANGDDVTLTEPSEPDCKIVEL